MITMPYRLASSLALVSFALCLLMGIQAGNSFATTVLRALLAMLGTCVIGLVVGWMGQKMLEENLRAEEKKLRDLETKLNTEDR